MCGMVPQYHQEDMPLLNQTANTEHGWEWDQVKAEEGPNGQRTTGPANDLGPM